jgi:hypothetical protein
MPRRGARTPFASRSAYAEADAPTGTGLAIPRWTTIDAGGLPSRQEREAIAVTGEGEVVSSTVIGEGGCRIYAPNATVSGNV